MSNTRIITETFEENGIAKVGLRVPFELTGIAADETHISLPKVINAVTIAGGELKFIGLDNVVRPLELECTDDMPLQASWRVTIHNTQKIFRLKFEDGSPIRLSTLLKLSSPLADPAYIEINDLKARIAALEAGGGGGGAGFTPEMFAALPNYPFPLDVTNEMLIYIVNDGRARGKIDFSFQPRSPDGAWLEINGVRFTWRDPESPEFNPEDPFTFPSTFDGWQTHQQIYNTFVNSTDERWASAFLGSGADILYIYYEFLGEEGNLFTLAKSPDANVLLSGDTLIGGAEPATIGEFKRITKEAFFS